MRPRQQLPSEASQLLRAQDGVISRAQLRELGLSDRVVSRMARAWATVHPGVFSTVPHEHPGPWQRRLWAVLLSLGRDAAACRRTAAHVLGLLEEEPGVIEVMVRSDSRFDRRRGVRIYRERSTFRRTRAATSLPCTSVEDTVLDLCDVPTVKPVVMWLTRAVQRRLTTPERLLAALAVRRRHAQRHAIREILGDVAGGTETVMEYRYLKDVEEAHGLPAGRRQVRLADGGIADVSYDEFDVLVELDGRVGHVEEGRFADFGRDNRNTARGKATLRYGYLHVTDGACVTAVEVGGLLTERGWEGELLGCPRCAGIRQRVGMHRTRAIPTRMR